MMKDEKFYLKPTTAVEPLVNSFVAWSHVVSPVPFSMHLKNYQLAVLDSYLENPDIHWRACRDPKLRSGPLVDIPPERAGEVEKFRNETERKLEQNLRLVNRLNSFQKQLIDEAQGESLDMFYGKLPTEMRGYVELLYDYYHRPLVRFIEPMMYESPYYHEDLQSIRLFTQKYDDGRSFFMSTPRLPDSGQIDLAIPLGSSKLDELHQLDRKPQTFGYIREMLGINHEQEALLRSLLGTNEVKPVETWNEKSVRIRYFGHACILIEWKGVSILTDPCLGVMPENMGLERFSYDDLPEKIDFALITHGHHDHFSLETLLRLRNRLGTLVVPKSNGIYYGDISLKTLARKLNFKNVVELDALESIPIDEGEIIGVPFLGEHADLPHGKSAFLVRCENEQMLFAADSDCLDNQLYTNLQKACGKIQSVFIGMECVGAPLTWSCGSFLPEKPSHVIEQSRRYKGCDSRRAEQILESVGAERLYIYAMGREPWLEFWLGLALTEDSTQVVEAKKLLKMAAEKGISDAKFLFAREEIHFFPTTETTGAKASAAHPENQSKEEIKEFAEDDFQF
jgi:L-ascorbate metabolism protein UlaG (beta-lactamase superfamily)